MLHPSLPPGHQVISTLPTCYYLLHPLLPHVGINLGGVDRRVPQQRLDVHQFGQTYYRTEPKSALSIRFITASTAIEPSIVVVPSRYITERGSTTPAVRVARRPSRPESQTPVSRRGGRQAGRRTQGARSEDAARAQRPNDAATGGRRPRRRSAASGPPDCWSGHGGAERAAPSP